eukprot:GILJ01015611.1.p1 GENE.GILJ01015611.1~~GILJ01015611.1.p1  ORF type:complete len:367 (-),score=52.38 GILJ01015611.1:465-1565(-)
MFASYEVMRVPQLCKQHHQKASLAEKLKPVLGEFDIGSLPKQADVREGTKRPSLFGLAEQDMTEDTLDLKNLIDTPPLYAHKMFERFKMAPKTELPRHEQEDEIQRVRMGTFFFEKQVEAKAKADQAILQAKMEGIRTGKASASSSSTNTKTTRKASRKSLAGEDTNVKTSSRAKRQTPTTSSKGRAGTRQQQQGSSSGPDIQTAVDEEVKRVREEALADDEKTLLEIALKDQISVNEQLREKVQQMEQRIKDVYKQLSMKNEILQTLQTKSNKFALVRDLQVHGLSRDSHLEPHDEFMSLYSPLHSIEHQQKKVRKSMLVLRYARRWLQKVRTIKTERLKQQVYRPSMTQARAPVSRSVAKFAWT